jgi:hypothetical protein
LEFSEELEKKLAQEIETKIILEKQNSEFVENVLKFTHLFHISD